MKKDNSLLWILLVNFIMKHQQKMELMLKKYN